MKIKLIFSSLIIGIGIYPSNVFAQQATTSSGGDISGTGGAISYSIGQVVYTTANGSNGSIAQGVQQPYEISITTELANTDDINLHFNAFPNPTLDFLYLTIENYNTESLSYQLFDINGKELESRKINNNSIKISTNELPAAVYFLKIMDSSKEIKTFKIIKK